MWKNPNQRLKSKLINCFHISLFLYLSLTNIISRCNYSFLDEKISIFLKQTKEYPLETKEKKTFRNKVLQDLKFHKILKNWNTKTITKIILNNEGKIVGYKVYKNFYPNYFTKIQIRHLIRGSSITQIEDSNLHTLKIKFHN